MDFRPLGRSGLSVSSICLGTMTWGQQNTEAEGHAQMDYALAAWREFLRYRRALRHPAEARRRKARRSGSSAAGSRRAGTATR